MVTTAMKISSESDMAFDYGKDWNPAENYKDERIAGNYDRERFSSLAGRTYNFLEKRLIRRAFAGLPRSASVADIPCGTGRLAEVLAEMGFRLTGIDISRQMLEVAERRLRRFPNFESHVSDVRALPTAGRIFEAALCARVLMHFPLAEQVEFLRAVATVTTGRVVFTQGLDTPYHRLRRRLKRLLGHQAPAVYPLTRKDMRSLIADAGLRKVRRYTLLPLVSEEVVVVCERRAGSGVSMTGE
jgi:ubiquinone/menaquinone biosynthesis C-methylase UbiE